MICVTILVNYLGITRRSRSGVRLVVCYGSERYPSFPSFSPLYPPPLLPWVNLTSKTIATFLLSSSLDIYRELRSVYGISLTPKPTLLDLFHISEMSALSKNIIIFRNLETGLAYVLESTINHDDLGGSGYYYYRLRSYLPAVKRLFIPQVCLVRSAAGEHHL